MKYYRDHLIEAMCQLGKDPSVVFVGYNCRYGKAGGTLAGVSEDQLIEMPLAENLMLGAAIGMSLDGFIPVVWFERCDFLTCAMDALVNHLNQIFQLSDGVHAPVCIIRVCVGNKYSPLFTGPTHTQNFANAINRLVTFNVVQLSFVETIQTHYKLALDAAKKGHSTMLIEFRDNYSNE